MLSIRLQRIGQKNQPSFRLVLTESKNAAKSGKFQEILGFHNFRKDGTTTMKADRIKYWIGVGAQVSDTAHNLLVTEKVLVGKKKNVLPKKTAPKKEEAVVEVVPAPVAEAPKAEEAATPEAVAEEVAQTETTPEVAA